MSKVNVFQPTSYRCGHLLVFALLLSSLTIFILWTKDIPQVLEFVRPSFHDGAQQYQPVQEMPRRFFAVEPGPDEGMTLIEENHLTPNGGFLHVVEPSGRTSFYGISMYHQLHCIDMLRAGLAGGALPSEHEHHHQARDEPRPTDKLTSNHMEHCLDYLAQVSPLLLLGATWRSSSENTYRSIYFPS